ncbi:T-cell surface antigen CD2 [Saccopteryx bilineata]|uniref:T-cell surface antigen CD2 n=1 Tax=Saccopteryx bilineata TaxID=59482 RepID=UPI00338E72FA
MSLACKILTSFLLIFIFSTKGAPPKTIKVHGTLNYDINLDIPNFSLNGHIDDIQWNKYNSSNRLARLKGGNISYLKRETYALLRNGTLKIKHLQRNDSGIYNVLVYDTLGKNVLEHTFDLKILERVSKPSIFWSCTNATLTCEAKGGTDPKLKLFQNENHITDSLNVITHKWTSKQPAVFKCTATNKISKETSVVTISCLEKGLDIYLITGICAGGILLLLCVVLLIVVISKRKRQHRRRNGEELEIRAHRTTCEEKGQKLHQILAPQNPASSQPPPPPGHRPHVHGQRPPPPGHRVQHQQQYQKRPVPPPGTQGHQQKGPPLPRPRVQPKSPRGASGNS